MKRHGPWRTLGLDPTEDRASIRRAYADKLRALDPDQDIDGYTKLRAARDQALFLARSMATAEAVTEPTSFDDASPLEDDGGVSDDAVFAPCDFADEDDWDLLADDLLDGGGVRFDAGPPTALDGSSADPATPAPPDVLLAVLFPDGADSEEPLTAEEWRTVHAALSTILADAEQAPIDRQSAIEDWLAHHLASAWPRSAWLVEDAAAAFGWLDESGKLSERPAVLFLNQRLKGMRFLVKVAEPRHPLHRAWVELSKPGPRPAFGFLRTSRDDVRRLLAGIRERYPEAESHLDPDRVASWEAAGELTPASAWMGAFRFLCIVAGLGVLRLCANDPAPPPPPIAVQMPWQAEQVDALVVELFGERLDDVTLRTKATELWINIDHARNDQGDSPGYAEDVTKELLVQLRGQTQLAARDATGADLIAIKQVKLALLRLIHEQGSIADCLDFETQGVVPTKIVVPEDVRRDERALAARLVKDGLFRPSAAVRMTATIPGAIIEQVMRSSGLPEMAVRNAARGNGDDATLCTFRLAFLEAVLRRPGEASTDLLRIL